MGRILIWVIVFLFGYLAFHVVVGVFLLQSAMRKVEKALPSREGSVTLWQHDSYFTINPGIRVSIHPRPWAAVLVGVGFGLVVLGLIFLLHVPVNEPL